MKKAKVWQVLYLPIMMNTANVYIGISGFTTTSNRVSIYYISVSIDNSILSKKAIIYKAHLY